MDLIRLFRNPLCAAMALLTLLLTAAPAQAAHVFFSFGYGYYPPYWYGPYWGYPYYGPAWYSWYGPYYWGYAPPPVVYSPPVVVVDRPVIAAPAPRCQQGLWRYQDGTIVSGIACLQPNGSWRIQQ